MRSFNNIKRFFYYIKDYDAYQIRNEGCVMNCQCSINWIHATDNTLTASRGKKEIKYRVYICENCKRYFIKRFYHLLEVDPEVQQVLEDGIIIKIPEEYLELFIG